MAQSPPPPFLLLHGTTRLIAAQPILLSRAASFLATWLEVTQSSSENAGIGHQSAAVFLVKNDDTCRTLPPLPELQVPHAKSLLSSAISHVSSWVKRSTRTLQSQASNVSEQQVFDKSTSADTKRVPRSQRLGGAAGTLGSAGACIYLHATTYWVIHFFLAAQEDAGSPTGLQQADPLNFQPPLRLKKSKSRPKAAAASGRRTIHNLTIRSFDACLFPARRYTVPDLGPPWNG